MAYVINRIQFRIYMLDSATIDPSVTFTDVEYDSWSSLMSSITNHCVSDNSGMIIDMNRVGRIEIRQVDFDWNTN